MNLQNQTDIQDLSSLQRDILRRLNGETFQRPLGRPSEKILRQKPVDVDHRQIYSVSDFHTNALKALERKDLIWLCEIHSLRSTIQFAALRGAQTPTGEVYGAELRVKNEDGQLREYERAGFTSLDALAGWVFACLTGNGVKIALFDVLCGVYGHHHDRQLYSKWISTTHEFAVYWMVGHDDLPSDYDDLDPLADLQEALASNDMDQSDVAVNERVDKLREMAGYYREEVHAAFRRLYSAEKGSRYAAQKERDVAKFVELLRGMALGVALTRNERKPACARLDVVLESDFYMFEKQIADYIFG